MKTYWDLSERQRSELSEADVERYIDAELMTKGVLRPEPLELVEEPPLPEPAIEIHTVGSSYGNRIHVDVVITAADGTTLSLPYEFSTVRTCA